MVNFKKLNKIKKNNCALISVYNKDKIEQICKIFIKNNIDIISTGATANYIKKIGYKCQVVSKFTNFHEILDGRVKTLHPKIHASLLFDRNNKEHFNKFNELNFPIINFVIVNLYPVEEMQKNNSNNKNYLEMIDIGGPALLRSAAKNYQSVTAICDVDDYKMLIKNLNKNNGKTNLRFRKKMAAKVFDVTSTYDFIISKLMHYKKNCTLKIYNHEKKLLRYGENPHQKAFYYKNSFKNSLFDKSILQGKQLSYNNILDIDSAYDCICEFTEPTCVIIKHNNPCGVASASKIEKAFLNAYSVDKTSAFGGVIALNRVVNEKLASYMISNFFEIIIAPKFSDIAKKKLKNKKKLILIEINKTTENNNFDIKSVNNGYLIQQKNKINFSKKYMKCVTKKQAIKKNIEDLVFSFKVCKHVKSNAIVLVNNKKTLGIGAGQMSRIDATKISLSKISLKNKKKGFVLASDAFFPFTDNIKLLLKYNCQGIIQPQGSLNDINIINFADKNNIPLYFSKFRFFRH